MATQKAIQLHVPGDARLVSDAPIPKLTDNSLIVKVAAVALNPTDWKHIHFLADAGATIGCDYAGVVHEVGKAITNGLRKGDRVAGFTHGGNVVNHETGAFAEYVISKGVVLLKIPDHLSFEEAATLALGVTTVGQGLYQSLGLPLPNQPAKEKFPILIYGGSTATGTLAIQFAKLSNLEVFTTCSPHNFDLVKGRGADHVFDFNSPSLIADIRKASNDKLRHAFDCISSEATAKICVESLGPNGGKYSSLIRVEKLPREDVENSLTIAYTAFGEDFIFKSKKFAASREDLDFIVQFQSLSSKLLEQGKIRPHPHRVRSGGLEAIPQGLQELREGKVSGEKLVYQIN